MKIFRNIRLAPQDRGNDGEIIQNQAGCRFQGSRKRAMIVRRISCALFALFVVACFSPVASAQTVLFPNVDDIIIDEIRLEGNKRNADEDLLYYIKQRRGSKLDLATVSADVKRLYNMKLYDDIQVDLEDEGGRHILTYTFVEKPSVASYLIEGNNKVSFDDLKEIIDLRRIVPFHVWRELVVKDDSFCQLNLVFHKRARTIISAKRVYFNARMRKGAFYEDPLLFRLPGGRRG